jgi:hypothetical protein
LRGGQRLNERRKPLEDFPKLTRDFGMVADSWREKNPVGAKAMGGRSGHGTMHAVLAGGVVSSRPPRLFFQESHRR